MMPTALVTGAGSGLGRGFALALARRGYQLLLAGRDEAKLQGVSGEIGPNAASSIYRVDLADSSSRADFIDAVLDQHGAPTLLINNAAIMPAGDFMEQPPTAFKAALAVNLLAPAELTRRFCALSPPPQGVFFVLSTSARFPQPYNSLYSASKTGLRALAEALQVELAGKTRVCLVYPPLTATSMTERLQRARWPIRMADPLLVAERVVAEYEKGKNEIGWFDWEVIPSTLYRIAPRLFRWMLKSQRKLLRGMYRANPE